MSREEVVDVMRTPAAKRFFLVCLATGLFALAGYAIRRSQGAEGPPSEGAGYVGMSECKKCHMKSYLTFRKTPKAKESWNRIASAPDKEKCYACHTTGYGKPGGFVSPEKTPDFQGVSCESCHGPGSAHVQAARDADQAKKLEDPETVKQIKSRIERHSTRCVDCHNPHVLDKAAKAREAK